MQDRRLLIPILSALVLIVVCTWRIWTNQKQEFSDQVAAASIARVAPGFEARDTENHMVRLAALLGRHKIIVVFFDGTPGPIEKDVEVMRERDLARMRDLVKLRERFSDLQSQNVKVVAISNGLPSQSRDAMTRTGKFPFPLVADIDPSKPSEVLRIHRQWGRIDSVTGQQKTGVFLIDRMGRVPYTLDGPAPLTSVNEAIDAALQ